MSRRERRSAFGLLARQSATDAPLAAIVAIVVAVCAFLVSSGPGALAEVSDRELRHTLEGFSAPRHDVGAAALFGYPNASFSAARQHERHRGDHGHRGGRAVSPDAAPRVGPRRAAVGSHHHAGVRDAATIPPPTLIGLTATPQWHELRDLRRGQRHRRHRSQPTPHPPIRRSREPVEIALSVAAAEQMDIGIGDILDSAGHSAAGRRPLRAHRSGGWVLGAPTASSRRREGPRRERAHHLHRRRAARSAIHDRPPGDIRHRANRSLVSAADR